MRIAFDPRTVPVLMRIPRRLPYLVVAILLMALLAFQAARLVWALAMPVGPIGEWRSVNGTVAADQSLLTRFDPFFRDGAATEGGTVVTSLALKLFGVRINQGSGQGSAIIATPDGVQSSYAVGEVIVPGVKLKSVTFDGVTIDRGGTAEQLFLDQSVNAPVVQSAAPGAPALAAPPVPLMSEIAFTPRIENGQPTGFVVAPAGSGTVFNSAGLKAGDVVTAINGQAIRSLDDARRALASNPTGAPVALSVERGGKTLTLSAKGAP